MIDRESRDQLVVLLQNWLSRQTTAGQVNERLAYLRKSIEDRLTDDEDDDVNQLLTELQDEFEGEHPNQQEQLDRTAWDYFHRWILLLKSDAALVRRQRRVWSWSCLFAGLSLVLYVSLVIVIGRNDGTTFLPLLSLPFAIIAIPLWKWRSREYARKLPEMSSDAEPFASYRQIREVRQTVKDFRKQVYPRNSPPNNFGWIDLIVGTVEFYGAWLIGLIVMSLFSPCLLVATCLPLSRYVTELYWPLTDEQHRTTDR